MANLGISNTHVNQFDRPLPRNRAAGAKGSMRHRLQTALHVGLFVAAFLFVAAIVCGVLV